MDSQLVDKIVHEVKSQGVFDEFRKDSMADVDTKPAYQNLRQRVEAAVKKFLADQNWTLDTNKNQLREKLRKHITESGFLDVGVERIVDQVVNPKIGSVFQPKIESIAYKYLGIPVPQLKTQPPPPPPPPQPFYNPLPPININGMPLHMEGSTHLPTYLEQVSPDSDKVIPKSDCRDSNSNMDMDIDDDKLEDEDESPPFEPLTKEDKSDVPVEQCSDMDESDSLNEPAAPNGAELLLQNDDRQNGDTQTQDTVVSARTAEGDSEKETSRFFDAVRSQESQLSEVSSDSHISAVSMEFGKNVPFVKTEPLENSAVISEEAQMPKFNENSSEADGIPTAAIPLHFDINKGEIKFEGTERKTSLLPSVPSEREQDREEKRHSHEKTDKTRKTDKREKDSKRPEKHTSSSSKSKHSSTSSRNSNSTSGVRSKRESRQASNSSVKHSISPSSNSSSRFDGRRDTSKNHNTSSAKKEVPSTTLPKKDARNADDHNESKEKLRRRQSSDSNDEDKSSGGMPNKSLNAPAAPSESASKATTKPKDNANETKVSQSEAAGQKAACNNNTQNFEQQNGVVVISNDVLQNAAAIDFIQLKASAEAPQISQVNVVSSTSTTTEVINKNTDSEELCFFEPMLEEFAVRLQHVGNAIKNRQLMIKNWSFDSFTEQPDTETKCATTTVHRATLKIDCIQYLNEDIVSDSCSNSKRFRHDKIQKSSPTPSDSGSVNSKENERFEKNLVDAKRSEKIIGQQQPSTAMSNKFKHQCYTSEDLYKPRPILSQRSRRRGTDAMV